MLLRNNLVDRIYLTRVHTEIDGDTYFDNLDDSWKLVHTDLHPLMKSITLLLLFKLLNANLKLLLAFEV